jgi:arylsulfatase A-like enzyme
MTSRRDLLKSAVCSLGGASVPSRARRRPNVLYLLTDDQRWDLLSLRGHPFVRTPNMDRIGREGALFANTFVTTSLCSPSRASFLTGRYPHQHQVRGNGSSETFDRQERTFPALLHEAGYRTGYIGKWHIGDNPRPRQGFDHWAVLPGQGEYRNPTLNIDGTMRSFDGHVDDIVADLAAGFLKSQSDKRPFCLCVGLKSPHAPQLPPERLRTVFADVEIPKPPSWYEDYRVTGKPDVVGKACIQAEQFFDGPIKLKGSFDRYMKDFYRSVMSADESIGRILRALDDSGSSEDTLVVFAGDNGFFLGEHHLIDKRLAYEESMRIPLLMRYPKGFGPGQCVSRMVLNLDVCPTVLDFCAVEAPRNIAGRSLRPLLEGRAEENWRKEILYEYDERIWQSPALVAIRTERYKYIEYLDPASSNELYDLVIDPGEMRNLIGDPQYMAVSVELRQRLDRLKRTTQWTPPDLSKPNTPCWVRKKPVS